MYCWSLNLITWPEGINNFVGSKNVEQEKRRRMRVEISSLVRLHVLYGKEPPESSALSWGRRDEEESASILPVSLNVAKESTNHLWGMDRQPEIHPHSQHDFWSFILPENQPKNRLGSVQEARVSFSTHLCWAAAKAIFLQVGARNQMFVVLVQRGEDWLQVTMVCSIELVGNGSLELSCTQKCRSWRVRHGCACGCSTLVIYRILGVLVVLFLGSRVAI